MLAGILGSLPSPLLCVVFQDCTTPVAPPWDVRNSVYSLKTLPLRVSSIPVRRGDFESLKMEQRRLNAIRSGAATFIDNRYSDFCCTFSYCQRLHSFSSKCPTAFRLNIEVQVMHHLVSVSMVQEAGPQENCEIFARLKNQMGWTQSCTHDISTAALRTNRSSHIKRDQRHQDVCVLWST